ncbi:hypothetical protein [Nostoc sp. DedQUE09]|uniref:hypothetical protein n=1 Tax=Nostoc sp. DedQUE09 TaxID=3075394 RepID=UPI002AD3036A|nr:hypothetical protein [Nostoc sp. DedQUE09]MDZ7952280.1 hypothetical protein [Nostoc sp. DedQUE09]
MSLFPSSFEQTLKLLTPLGAFGSFLWGVMIWRDKSDKELAQAKTEAERFAENRRIELAQAETEAERFAESRRIEATKPFLDRQLKLYTEASQVAAKIATSTNVNEVADANKRFWELYWGELALVENKDVEAAMVALGKAIEDSAPKQQLQKLSLKLAHACRSSLNISWGINAWSQPDYANIPQEARRSPKS